MPAKHTIRFHCLRKEHSTVLVGSSGTRWTHIGSTSTMRGFFIHYAVGGPGNSRHPDTRRVWRWGPGSGPWHHFGGCRRRITGGLIIVCRRGVICTLPRKTISIFPRIPEDALRGAHRCPKTTKGIPKDGQREPKATQREPQVQNRVHEKYTMVIHSKRIKSYVHEFDKWTIHPKDFFGNVLPPKSSVTQKS